MTPLVRIGCAVAVGVLLTAAGADSQPPPAHNDIIAGGRQVYLQTCASCHGDAATGYGPASWLLKERPPDLTQFSSRTVPFPRERLRNIITGRVRLVPSHHASEMPAWPLDATMPLNGVTKLDALLTYLDAIQLQKFGPYQGHTPQTIAAAGKGLFPTHCSTCHGEDGRGVTPPGYVVGASVDLTTIAARNAGAFELRRVYESIARCEDESRRTEMPEWRQSFVRAGWGEYVAMKNLEALATYLEAIQR